MSKSVKLINEGFSRKYMKEDLQAALEKDVRNVLKRNGYDITVDGADNAIEAFAEYINMSREFGDDISVEEWLKETELNHPEELSFMKLDDEKPLKFVDNRKNSIIHGWDDPGYDEYDESLKEGTEVKEIFHNDNGTDYEVIERSASGKNALLRNGPKWIVAWNCPEDSGSWGQGHYFFDEKEARKVWEDKYVNESLKENIFLGGRNNWDLFFTSVDDLLHILQKIRNSAGNEDFDVVYRLGHVGGQLELTKVPEVTNSRYIAARIKDDAAIDKFIDNWYGGSNEYDESLKEENNTKFKLNDPIKEYVKYISPKEHQLNKIPSKMTFADVLANMRSGRGNLITSGIDSVVVSQILNELERMVGADTFNKVYKIWRNSNVNENYHKKLTDKKEGKSKINKPLKIGGKDESMLPEDFNEKNLNKISTLEYEANPNRQRRIDLYRKYAHLDEDVEITEDNIDDWALGKVACRVNREPAKVKAEILGQRYSDYEKY